MIELIGLVVVVVFGYSVVQSYKRGNVSEEEKKQNPTLVESLGEAIDTAHKYSERLKMKAQLEAEHFTWFKNFNRSVSSALEHAEFMEDHNLKLDNDPELRSLFEETLADFQASSPKSASDQNKNIPEQAWYTGGIPAEPDAVSDPEVNLWLKRSHANHLLEHQKLVQRVRKRISSSSRIDSFFRDALSERNLTKLYLDFFRQENEPRNSYLARSQSKASEPNSQPSFSIFNDLSKLGNLPPDTKADLVSDHEEDSSCINDYLKKYLDNAPDRLVDPPIEELNKLPTPLEPGERRVLAFFLDCLGPDWEIYVQPHLNGLRPDFVLLNPKVGIGVFEVKNWNFGAVEYFPKSVANGRVELWGRVGGKEFSKEHDNPFRKIVIYKQELFDIYCPRLKSKAGFAAITGGVIFPSAPTKEVRSLQKAFLGDSESKTSSVYFPVCGREELFAKDLQKIFPESSRERSNLMTPALAGDLRGWLVEPDFSKTQRERLPLDTRQRRLAETRTASGFRRIKGPAGSGKSIVLAARAARLASEGKKVLVVTFNITLWHYLRDMIRRDISKSEQMNNIVFTHFHKWCRDVCVEIGFGGQYSHLFSEVRKLEAGDGGKKSVKRQIAQRLLQVMDDDIPSLAATAVLSQDAPRYDAILVDEGQDFLPLWWNALKNCKKADGEMVLVADTTQDIYDKSSSWTDEAMNGAGFTGEWSRLDVSYRLPQKALEAAQEFARRYLPSGKLDLAKTSADRLSVEPCHLRWVQCSPDKAKKNCVDAILAMMRNTKRETGLANADITFICNENSFGKSVTDELNTYTGIRTVDTFELDRVEQARSKMAFWMGDARIKATTLHSFKGWESRLLVVHVGNAVGDESLASIYAALTRLKHSPLGSWLTVVCSAPELADYGRSWAKFQSLEGGSPQH